MKQIFVFGSNLAGRHGKGAALEARLRYGAIYGQGLGRQGNSFGIPTKDGNLKVLPLSAIQFYVNRFIEYAKYNKNLAFLITRVGCGLAGYQDSEIAPMFKNCPSNCTLPQEWKKYIEDQNSM